MDRPQLVLSGINPHIPNGLTTHVNKLHALVYARSTAATLASQQRKFFSFLTQYALFTHDVCGSVTVPTITPMHLIFFASWLHSTGHRSYASISNYCSAVRTWCRQQGRIDPGLTVYDGRPQPIVDPTYFAHMRAIKRHLGGTTNKRQPLTLSALDKLIHTIERGYITTQNQSINMRAAVLHAFCTLLRISEYTTKDRHGHTVGVTASRGDIIFFPSIDDPEGYRFTIHQSKTDQFRTSVTLTTFAQQHSPTCPVKAMRDLFLFNPQPPTAPLFDFRANNRVGRPNASRAAYSVLLKNLLYACGIPTDTTKPHSLRSGGATALLQAGVSPYIIQKIGRWQSWSFSLYAEVSTNALRMAAALLSTAPRDAAPVNLKLVRQDIQ
jgi:hypothetical protein